MTMKTTKTLNTQALTKTYRDNPQIGMVKHSVSFHDGVQTYRDGSPFFDLQCFSRRKDKELFILNLKAEGYLEKY